jgi:hypothetical protein
MGLFILCLLCWVASEMIKLLSNINNLGSAAHGSHNWPASAVYAAYFVGILMGYITGFMLFNAVSHIAMAFYDYRKDKMLVEFWDSLSDAEKSRLRQGSS